MAESNNQELKQLHQQFRALSASQNPQAIIDLANETLMRSPDQSDEAALSQAYLAHAKLLQGDRVAAESIWSSAEDREFNSAIPALIIAEGFQALGDTSRALKSFTRATSLEPNDGNAWLQLSQAMQFAGNIEGARRSAKRSIDLLPDNPDAHGHLGIISLMSNDLMTAETELTLAAKTSGGALHHATNLVNFLKQHKTNEDCLAISKELLETSPNNPVFLALKGEVLLRMDDLDEAQPLLEQAAHLNPNDQNVLRLLNEIYKSRLKLSFGASQMLPPQDLARVYQNILETTQFDSNELREASKKTIRYLSFLIPVFWFLLFFGAFNIDFSRLFCSPWNCYLPPNSTTEFDWKHIVVSSTVSTLATSFLVAPSIISLRKNHIEQRACRLAIEDYTRKKLTLNFLAVYSQRTVENSEFVQLTLDHFNDKGNADEILLKAKDKKFKYAKGYQAWRFRKAIVKLSSSVRKLAKRIQNS